MGCSELRSTLTVQKKSNGRKDCIWGILFSALDRSIKFICIFRSRKNSLYAFLIASNKYWTVLTCGFFLKKKKIYWTVLRGEYGTGPCKMRSDPSVLFWHESMRSGTAEYMLLLHSFFFAFLNPPPLCRLPP